MVRKAVIGLTVTKTQELGIDTLSRRHFTITDTHPHRYGMWTLRDNWGNYEYVTDAELKANWRAVVITKGKIKGSKYQMCERHWLREIV